MAPALVCLALAAVCSGVATILQAVATRRSPVEARIDVGLFWRLARSRTYVAALTLVAAGFALSFLALRTLPLFAVQAGRASSLGVAAVLAVLVLGARLRVLDVVALVATGAGLMLVALAVSPRPGLVADGAVRVTVVGLAVLVAVAGALAVRVRRGRSAGAALAVLAGLAFAGLSLGARTLPELTPAALVADPLAWAMAVSGGLGLALGALALQRTSVVAASAAMVAVETCVGAALGTALAGDRPAPGAWPVASAGFALVVLGSVALARFGVPDAPDAAGSGAAGSGERGVELDRDALGREDPAAPRAVGPELAGGVGRQDHDRA